jgi:hypothetical protein
MYQRRWESWKDGADTDVELDLMGEAGQGETGKRGKEAGDNFLGLPLLASFPFPLLPLGPFCRLDDGEDVSALTQHDHFR